MLARDVVALPYDLEHIVKRDNVRMLGKLSSIRDEKLFFQKELAPGQVAETVCKWSDLTALSVVELEDFYLMKAVQRTEPNNSEVARRAIAIALFAREYTLPENLIGKYLNMASQTGANIKELTDKLFVPGIKP